MYAQLAQRQTLSSNFAIAQRCLLCDVIFRTIIAKFSEKTGKLSSVKLICKRMMCNKLCMDWQRSRKLVAVGQKWCKQLMHACCYPCC